MARYGARMPAEALEHPLTVLVPVFNAAPALRALADSLLAAHPQPAAGLRFVFIDDASTDAEVPSLLAQHPFFGRPDVHTHTQEENLGFVRTVNWGLELAGERDDVLLLNSDTEIHGRAIATLQRAAHRRASIGSVTPLTNNGTIASLFAWPRGTESRWGFSPSELTRLVEARAFPTP